MTKPMENVLLTSRMLEDYNHDPFLPLTDEPFTTSVASCDRWNCDMLDCDQTNPVWFPICFK